MWRFSIVSVAFEITARWNERWLRSEWPKGALGKSKPSEEVQGLPKGPSMEIIRPAAQG